MEFSNSFIEEDGGNSNIQLQFDDNINLIRMCIYQKNVEKNYTFLYKSIEYKNNMKNGLFKQYYSNTQLNIQASYKDNKFDGKRFFYYENGNVKSEEFFIDDKPEGIYRQWTQNGNLDCEIIYENSKEISRQEYDVNGEPLYE